MKFLSCEKLSEHKYKTPEGYLICVDSVLARTGKQTYKRSEVFGPDCKDADVDVEIDRPEKEVFSEKTLASFENKPLTVEHPDTDVNIDNHNELAVGFVRDIKRGNIDGNDVMLGTLVVTDAKTIEEIENGEHTDLSCGYDCDINDEENPCQRNIRGNHVALCQQGRAGIAHIVDSLDTIFAGTTVSYEVWLIYPKTGRRFMAAAYMTSEEARRNSLQLRKEWTNDKDGMPNIEIKFKDSIKDSRTRAQIQADIDKVEREIDWCEDHNNVWKLNDLHKQLDKLQEELKGVKDAVHTILCKDKVFHFETIDKDGKIGAIAVEAKDEKEAKLKAEQDLKREIAMFGKQMRLGKLYSVSDSVKDSLKTFEVEYKDSNNVVIQLVKAKSLEDAIKKAKELKK